MEAKTNFSHEISSFKMISRNYDYDLFMAFEPEIGLLSFIEAQTLLKYLYNFYQKKQKYFGKDLLFDILKSDF